MSNDDFRIAWKMERTTVQCVSQYFDFSRNKKFYKKLIIFQLK